MVHFFIEFSDDFFDDARVDFAHSADGGGDLTDLVYIKLLHDGAPAFFTQTQKQDRRLLRARHMTVFAKGYKLVHESADSCSLRMIGQG